MKTLIYDIETYPNIFTCSFSDGSVFEISWRKNQIKEFVEFLHGIDEMVGFNNFMFDYPVVHFIIENQYCTPYLIYKKAQQIIDTVFNSRYKNVIWPKNQHVQQIDLFLIHHFDNAAKSTSLKALQIAMRSRSVQDLPFTPGQYLTDSEMDELIEYNIHDVEETFKFWEKSEEQISSRRQTFPGAMNANDTKIGTKYFEKRLQKYGLCYDEYGNKRQTLRLPPFDMSDMKSLPQEFQFPDPPRKGKMPVRENFRTEEAFMKAYDNECSENIEVIDKWNKACTKKLKQNAEAVWIPVKKILFRYIGFQYQEFKDVFDFYQNLNVTHTKSGISTKCDINGFTFSFGAGGVHGSVKPSSIYSTNEYVIRDIDVTSYYPNLSIQNNLFPAHLGKEFCRINKSLFNERMTYEKLTVINKILKLALNSVFGNSNNKYSVFYDPQYTMSITINGQLLLCMLAEWLICITDLEIIQINTDGITVRYPRVQTPLVEKAEAQWVKMTMLDLEYNNYKAIHIRDVNNYIAVYENGKIKRKGAYEYERDWYQNHSGLVIQKAVETFLLHGTDISEFIVDHEDKFDFMMRGKVNKTDRLVLAFDEKEIEQQKTTRFYFSEQGGELFKYMPPLKSKPDHIRRNAYQGTKGWKVKICNNMEDFDGDINYEYYIEESYKLVNVLER